jgi:signal transduction histidine kinase/ligand-binding sensor domain-containing protein
MDDGLSQGSNYFKYEDSKGFMWITCNDAVNRYDGQTVKVFNKEKYFNACPILQQGYGITEDNKSNIYIGSQRGLYIYLRKENRFILKDIYPNETEKVAMPFGFFNGKIWCFNKNYKIVSYDVETCTSNFEVQLNTIPLKSIHVYELAGNNFYYYFPFIDKNENAWITTENNVFCYNLKTKHISEPFYDYLLTHEYKSFYANSYDFSTNQIYIGTQNSLIKYDIDTKKIEEIYFIENRPLQVVYSIASNSSMIAFRSGNEIYFISKQFKKLVDLNSSILNKYSRSFGFSFDKSNRFWMCDDGNGQVIFNFNKPILNKEPSIISKYISFENTGVNRFAEMNDSTVVIPSYVDQKNILITHNNKNNSFKKFEAKFLGQLVGYDCTSDRYRKGIWLTRGNFPSLNQKRSIIFLNNNFKIIYDIKLPANDTLGTQQDIQVLSDGRVLCTFAKGTYWINLTSLKLEKTNGDLIANPFKINQLSKNKLAISSLNGDMKLITILKDSTLQIDKNILPGILSFYIQPDTSRKKYWIGTNQGIYVVNKHFEVIKKFDISNGLAGTYIYGLLLDNVGNLFCSHQHGLSTIYTDSYQILNFDKNDGIQSWDYNNRSFLKTSDGVLYFGGNKGFNYFKPPLDFTSYYKPEIYIDEITVNKLPYRTDVNSDYIQQLALNYNENNIEIKAVVKDLANAEQQQIIYKFAGNNSNWTYLPNNSTLRFSNLAPDTYTLELGTYNKFTNQEQLQKRIIFSIAAPFYLKSWFWILLSISVTALIFILINKRKQAQQKLIKTQQLALEQQRAKITADLHDDIGATLSSLQINSAVANKLIHTNIPMAEQVLDKIESQSKALADKIGDIIWSMKPGKDEFMTMSSRIKTFANDILAATNIHYTISIDREVDEKIKDISIRKNIVLITKEALNNCAKYSHASEATIKLYIEKNILILNITDNGIGFDTEVIQGNGLSNMKNRVKELHGYFEVKSSTAKGTYILVKIPCP